MREVASSGGNMFAIRKLEPYPVWHVEIDDRWELAMMFLRIQEHYESANPDFQGKIFTLEDYMDWYVRTHVKSKRLTGAFTYASDWSAFNVPSTSVLAVYMTFPGHSRKETLLFEALLREGAFENEHFYVIANRKGASRMFFEHEFRHALFAVNCEYREEISRIVQSFSVAELRAWILEHYSLSVLTDEIQAYALTGWPRDVPVVTDEMEKLRCKLKIAEKKYITR